MYDESDLLPLSGLQHLVFCERQCALIHVERLWKENILTAEGRLLHERVDSEVDETRGGVRIVRGLSLWSLRLGLSAKADLVEFHPIQDQAGAEPSRSEDGAALPGLPKGCRPIPVEYKRGEPKYTDCDRVQLCAQALCLEEMFNVSIPEGRLFYGRRRRRLDVLFDEALRRSTEEAARRFHQIVDSRETPIVHRQKKCRSCSLLDLCLPPAPRRKRSAEAYLRQELWSEPVPGGEP